MFTRKKFAHSWEGYMKPFKIIGNVYYVGCFQESSHLIDTGDGLILIDVGSTVNTWMLVDSIHRLGFRPDDIKYIVHTHWHGDHTEGTPAIVTLSGAKTTIGRDDAEKAKRYFEPDIIVSDGDTLSLGNTTIRFMETPGHTKGTVSLFFDTVEDGRTYRVGMFGGAGANTLASGAFDYEGCRDGYRASLNRLRGEKVDVMLGNHTWNNDTYFKSLRLFADGTNEFIDDKLWCRFLDFCEKRLDEVIAKEAAK